MVDGSRGRAYSRPGRLFREAWVGRSSTFPRRVAIHDLASVGPLRGDFDRAHGGS